MLKEDDVWQMILTDRSANTDNEKCFVKCLGESYNIMNKDDGKLNPIELKKPLPFIDSNKVEAGIKKCSSLEGINPCDTATKQGECLFEIAGIR